ncbi:MAG TPA: hypothetical protein DIC36_01335 [Gammaproteobacteria bacterium]|nr:hypothetical protein [Gammaproteobacteria bacterium]
MASKKDEPVAAPEVQAEVPVKVKVFNKNPKPLRRAGHSWPSGQWAEQTVDQAGLKALRKDPGLTVEVLSA